MVAGARSHADVGGVLPLRHEGRGERGEGSVDHHAPALSHATRPSVQRNVAGGERNWGAVLPRAVGPSRTGKRRGVDRRHRADLLRPVHMLRRHAGECTPQSNSLLLRTRSFNHHRPNINAQLLTPLNTRPRVCPGVRVQLRSNRTMRSKRVDRRRE